MGHSDALNDPRGHPRRNPLEMVKDLSPMAAANVANDSSKSLI
jgi:hypothetical protein